MYADRVESGARSSVKDRLNGGATALESSGRRRSVTGKRQREDDDKWQHDLFDRSSSRVSKSRIGANDLRLKLLKKGTQQATQSSKGSISGGVRDLREKLSGVTYSPPVRTAPPKPKPVIAVSEHTRRSVIAEAPESEKRKVSSVSKKTTPQKPETVDSFLQALGLEKYSISFQKEEVDMTALLHMTDDDLKAMGIPMGPRKKILLALESKA